MQTAKRRMRFLPLMERVCAGSVVDACRERVICFPRFIAIRINSDPIHLVAQASRRFEPASLRSIAIDQIASSSWLLV